MDLNPGNLLDPGAIAHKVVDSFLPKDMQWVGGLVGAAVDYQAGNEAGAAQQTMSALSDMKDLPQSSTANKPATNGAAPATSKPTTQASSSPPWSYEPSPPESRVTTITITTTTTTTSPGASGTSAAAPKATNGATPPGTSANPIKPPSGDASATAPKTMGISDLLESYLKAHPASAPPAKAATAPAGAPPAVPTSPPPDPRLQSANHGGWQTTAAPPPPPPPLPKTQSTTTTTTTVTSGSSPPPARSLGWKVAVAQLENANNKAAANAAKPAAGTTASPGPAIAPGAARINSASASTPATNASPATPAASTKPSNVDPSTLSKDNFMKLSDDDLMKAVRDGKIPTDVTDSNDGMLELQARMNHISEMNQMMTTMMQSMHQMKMSVIENIKA